MRLEKSVAAGALLFLTLCAAVWSQQGAPPQKRPAPPVPAVKVGEVAPDFTLRSHELKDVKLSDFQGKKNVILAFYVLAFTGGWTKELTAYQGDIAKFEEMDTQILGISVDSPYANKAYAKELGLTFPLLSDFKRDVVRKYGIFAEDSNVAYRTTIVVDKAGVIQSIEQGSQAIDINGAKAVCSKLSAPKR